MGNLVHNEQVKLRATFYNNSGIVLTFGGIIAPLLGYAQNIPLWKTGLLLVVAIVTALGIHQLALRTLKDLKE